LAHKELLLQRLDEIGRSLERTGRALALIGLGSVGVELARLDEYSDLDFYVIAQDGRKGELIDDLGWLSAVHPVAYAFRNTVDGYKALFEDGVFCEFAVFTVDELESIPSAEGRVVWHVPGFDRALARPHELPAAEPRSADWLLGEALTNLYVGLGRYRRGEKLSAFRFVQGFAVDRVLELARLLERESPAFRDAFAPERRFEQRFPETARALPTFLQGYDATPESALAILDYLTRHFDVNPSIDAAILHLATGQPGPDGDIFYGPTPHMRMPSS
jgi:hypothetical protein